MMLVACADPPSPGDQGPLYGQPASTPDVAEIVCESDGSSTVRTPEVVVQPDGIHVHVVSHLDEPAEIVGLFGQDVEPGVTDFVSVIAPGRVDAGCFPYSQHEDPDSLVTSPIEVLDPQRRYVDGQIQCVGTSWGSVSDFAEPPIDAGPVPLDVARATIKGLLPDDEVLYTGYPEQAERTVAVRRVGEVVATFDFVTFDGEAWSVAGSTGCSSSGLE